MNYPVTTEDLVKDQERMINRELSQNERTLFDLTVNTINCSYLDGMKCAAGYPRDFAQHVITCEQITGHSCTGVLMTFLRGLAAYENDTYAAGKAAMAYTKKACIGSNGGKH